MCAHYQPLALEMNRSGSKGPVRWAGTGEMGREPLCSEQRAPGHTGRSSQSTPRLWKEVPDEKLSAKCASHSPGSLHTSPFASPLPCTFASIPTLLSLPTSWTYLCCKHPFGSTRWACGTLKDAALSFRRQLARHDPSLPSPSCTGGERITWPSHLSFIHSGSRLLPNKTSRQSY